ncbi:cytochrome P450 4c3 [Trichonephila clavipes]|nr:cytochrome P450 4c3 [Trichonephila clavipes]
MWNVTDWQKVVFSDESRFVLGTDDNRVRVWRRPGERYNSPHTVLRHTARTAGVMVWGVIAYDSRSTLLVMRGTLTGQHSSMARSPDLSPVEHVWDQLKRQMPSCHSVHDLELAVQDLWGHLPQDNIRCLINSMPDRVAACQLLSRGKGEHEKSWHYDVLGLFLGTGLITRPIEKWKPRRKLLTPCFHSDILREYLKVFNECSQNLVKHLRKETKKEFTHIDPLLALTTMDIIYNMSMSRHLKFWEWSNFIHNLTTGRKIKHRIKFIEDFINSVIQEKKKEYLSGNKDNVKGKRKSFMNLLLELHFETQELSEKDIRDEVNTFVAAVYIKLTLLLIIYE